MRNGLHRRRLEDIRRRKNFLPSVILDIIFWILLALIVLFASPDNPLILILFFILVFLAIFFTFAIIFINVRRGLMIALSVTLILVLRYLGLDNVLNFLILAGAFLAFELYFSLKT